MSLRSTWCNQRLLLGGLCFCCLMPLHAAVVQETPVQADPGEEIDEITVVAPRSLIRIERQIERADIAMYKIANDLIDDPMYKVFCRIETFGISNIKRRICVPGYEREMMSDAWGAELRMLRDGHGELTFNSKLPEAELRQHREKMKQMMIDLAAENSELEKAILERAHLQRDYEKEWQRRRNKDE